MTIRTPRIDLDIKVDDDFIVGIKQAEGESSATVTELESEIAKQFTSYFAGELKEFDVEYHLNGSNLQLATWAALARVPYSKTISYTGLALLAGYPKAIRAVATAVRQNPVPVIIPCHRVVRKDGELGNYSLGGPEVKRYLLDLEQKWFTPRAERQKFKWNGEFEKIK